MDKYEYRVKTEQMLEHYEKKQFRKAMEIADTIDWRRVKSPAMLNTVSEIYENNGEFQKSRDTLMIAFDRAPSSRKVVYRLAVLALKLNDLNEASDCYEEFVKLAPRDPNQFILKYRILKAQGSDLSEQISALEEFKKAEYIEKWAYELAKLYHEAGMTSKCLEECDDLILWFSEGKYVYQAMELKMKYKPLTPLQQEKYDEYKGVPKKEPKKAVDKKPERAALKDVKSIPQDTVSIPKEQIKAAQEAAEAAEAEQQESGANTTETVDGLDATRRIPTAELGEALKAMEENAKADKEVPIEEAVSEEPVSEEPVSEEPEAPSEEPVLEPEEAVSEEPEVVEMEAPVIEPIGKETPEEARNVRELEGILQHAAEGPKKSITTVVKGATLQEALANGVAMASGINPEDQKKMEEREEELRIEGQMKIEDILMEWEAKQKVNAEAIAKQKASDEERLRKEREALEARREAERLEAERREAEEIARRKAEEKARQEAEEKARREAEEKARREAEEKARREAEEKARREAEEKARLEAEEARRKALLSDDIRQLVEELEDRVTAQEKEEENFDIEEELELAKAEGESVEEEIVDQFISEEELDDIVEEPEESEEEPEEEIVEAVSEEEETEDEDSEDEDDFEEEDDLEEDDFEEEDFEDELPEIPDPEDLEGDLEIEEPSEEEIQRRIKKSKGSGVPFDTGFVVTGRYDLSATSEIGLKAGLTEEQKKLFSYFVPVRGMSEQIVAVLDNDRRAQREGTSRTGNLMIIGRKGSGKTVLAVDIVKAIQKQRNLKQGKVAIVTGESLNKKELGNIIQKLRGGAIIIEKAGKLNSRTIKELNALMSRKTGELLFVLEDQRKPLERIMTANPDFKKKFTSKLELPVFINDELVTFGQTYAKENGYKLDEMGILALYSRIDVMQREDHAVTVAEVKEIMDEAIKHSQKANVKHLARRVFGKSTDSSDRIILKEEDFKI